MENSLTLGECLLIARRRQSLTAKALARQLKVAHGTVLNWECDRTRPRERDLDAIADVLELDVDELRSRCFDDAAGQR